MPDDENLDLAFGALADPTRRGLLQRLRAGETLTVSQLAEPIDMSLPAVMKHITVLETAGLIIREKKGRTVHCRLDPDPMREAMTWLEDMQSFWSERLDALAQFVEGETAEQSGEHQSTLPASKAKAGLTRRREKS